MEGARSKRWITKTTKASEFTIIGRLDKEFGIWRWYLKCGGGKAITRVISHLKCLWPIS